MLTSTVRSLKKEIHISSKYYFKKYLQFIEEDSPNSVKLSKKAMCLVFGMEISPFQIDELELRQLYPF